MCCEIGDVALRPFKDRSAREVSMLASALSAAGDKT